MHYKCTGNFCFIIYIMVVIYQGKNVGDESLKPARNTLQMHPRGAKYAFPFRYRCKDNTYNMPFASFLPFIFESTAHFAHSHCSACPTVFNASCARSNAKS